MLLLVCLLILDAGGSRKAVHRTANLCSTGSIELNQGPMGAMSDSPGFAIKEDERVSSLKSKDIPCIRTLTAFLDLRCSASRVSPHGDYTAIP